MGENNSNATIVIKVIASLIGKDEIFNNQSLIFEIMKKLRSSLPTFILQQAWTRLTPQEKHALQGTNKK